MARKKSPRKGLSQGGKGHVAVPGAIGRFASAAAEANRPIARAQAPVMSEACHPLPCKWLHASRSAGSPPSRPSPVRNPSTWIKSVCAALSRWRNIYALFGSTHEGRRIEHLISGVKGGFFADCAGLLGAAMAFGTLGAVDNRLVPRYGLRC